MIWQYLVELGLHFGGLFLPLEVSFTPLVQLRQDVFVDLHTGVPFKLSGQTHGQEAGVLGSEAAHATTAEISKICIPGCSLGRTGKLKSVPIPVP